MKTKKCRMISLCVTIPKIYFYSLTYSIRKYTIKLQVNHPLIHVIFSIHNFIYSAKLRFRRCQIFLRKVLNMIHFVVLTSRNCKGVELIVYIKTPT